MGIKDVLKTVIRSKKRPAVLVVGDLMVDHYIWGAARRLSPEAPVPVLSVKNETVTPGGAGNVAQNLLQLHARVTIGGVVGNDDAGRVLVKQLDDELINTANILIDAARPTTIKSRMMAGNHQLLRVDKEVTAIIDSDLEQKLLTGLEKELAATDMVLLSDYNKGVLSPSFTQKLIRLCNKKKKKVIVDPKGLYYEKYSGAYLVKPNKRELAEAAVVEGIADDKELNATAKKLLSKIKCDYLVVTRSEEGLDLISKKEYYNFPVKANEVFDVTGAGDTVFASLGYFLALGMDIKIACELANYAAAVAVSKVGSVAVTMEEIAAIATQTKK
ncbi:MAG TPA: D-glycero-beta-D-manno-heptose-7-phosphate kinase [Niabella sp.]